MTAREGGDALVGRFLRAWSRAEQSHLRHAIDHDHLGSLARALEFDTIARAQYDDYDVPDALRSLAPSSSVQHRFSHAPWASILA